MNTDEKYFSWYDCWVITGILWSTPDETEIDLSAIIAAGDMLNHAIYTEKELKDGFYKAQKKGLISIKDNKIRLTEQGLEIKAKVQNMRGGLFSIVDNMQKKLNSKRTKFLDVSDESIDTCHFITVNTIQEGHAKYSSHFKKNR
jgi:hypothetical protein